ncbi:MAG: DUF1592 domain-containing protein [Myxococcales bacterium]|nr:DUF1592 domain-containing protein [Myxococcales bacterium]
MQEWQVNCFTYGTIVRIRSLPHWARLLVTMVAVPSVGCVGAVDGSAGPLGGGPRDVEYPDGFEAGLLDEPVPSTRFARLTHEQWENTIEELFHLDEPSGLVGELRTDTAGGSLFANEGSLLEVDAALWGGYQRAASAMAERLLAEPALLASIVPPDEGDAEARAEAFVKAFGMRAYRRELTEDEVTTHLAIFAEGAEAFPNADAFDAGVAIVVEAMLQSPYFLYRAERSVDVKGGKIPLSSFEVASRLSYAIWNSMPDDVLFSLAQSGTLSDPTTVKGQVDRMLEHDKARATLAYYHRMLLASDRLLTINPDQGTFGDVAGGLGAALETANAMTIDEIVSNQSLGLKDLLLQPTTFVNAKLASVYGLEGTFDADTFTKVELPPETVNGVTTQTRAGFVTQAPFLALNASSKESDPIHRGVYIIERITCSPTSPPPNNIPPLSDASGTTMRQKVENLTEGEGTVCAGCHKTTINPFGFALENYDAIGQYRTEDHGESVDTSSTPPLDGKPVAVDGPIELSQALAASPQVHQCYARHWLEYLYARTDVPEDSPLLERVGDHSLTDDLSVKELIVDLVMTDAFLTRSVEELPEASQ